MFHAAGPQEARNDDGVTVEIDGYVLRYIDGSRVMEFGSEPGMPTLPGYQALFNVYFPVELRWLAPHRDEAISLERKRGIEDNILRALEALHCQLNYTVPLAS